MKDYITISINESVLNEIIYFFIYVMFLIILIWMIDKILEIIYREVKEAKKRKFNKIALPYRRYYKDLLKKKNYKKAKKYYKENTKYLNFSEYQFKGNYNNDCNFPNSDFVRTSLNNNIKSNFGNPLHKYGAT